MYLYKDYFTRLNFINNIPDPGSSKSQLNRFVKKNIFLAFVFKFSSAACTFITVPLILQQLSLAQYGIWLTAASFYPLITMFDLGIGNWIKNRVTEAIAKGEQEKIKGLISTAYFLFISIGTILILIFLILYPFINWVSVLQIPKQSGQNIDLMMLIILVLFVIQFVLRVINYIFAATQHNFMSYSLNFLTNLFILIVVLFFVRSGNTSLFQWCVILASVPVFSIILSTIYFFRSAKLIPTPSYSSVQFNSLSSMMFSSLPFFISSVCALVLFSTDNFLVNYFFGAENVTRYDLAMKYFHIVIIGINIILSPFWTAFTHAYYTNDIEWIKKVTRKLVYLWIAITTAVTIMLIISPVAYKLWLGDKVSIPFSLSVGMALYTILTCWNSVFIHFINGVGKLRLVTYVGIFIMVLNIPIAILLVKLFHFGPTGVIISNCICLFIGAVICPIQYFKIINKKATGIWFK